LCDKLQQATFKLEEEVDGENMKRFLRREYLLRE